MIDEQVTAARNLYVGGETLVEIAIRFGFAASTVRRCLNAEGVPLRPAAQRHILAKGLREGGLCEALDDARDLAITEVVWAASPSNEQRRDMEVGVAVNPDPERFEVLVVLDLAWREVCDLPPDRRE